jgi:hypothetical protein
VAFISFDVVKQILKDCEGKTFGEAMDRYESKLLKDVRHERMDPYYIPSAEELGKQMERHGFKFAPETKAILGKQATQVIMDDPHIPLIPQVSEADRMWNLVVLAARSSRYDE